MIRPSNCASRCAESVWMVAIFTVKLAVLTVVPLITICPVTAALRPTAVCDWPIRISWTRYPTCDPRPTVQRPRRCRPRRPRSRSACWTGCRSP